MLRDTIWTKLRQVNLTLVVGYFVLFSYNECPRLLFDGYKLRQKEEIEKAKKPEKHAKKKILRANFSCSFDPAPMVTEQGLGNLLDANVKNNLLCSNLTS